MILDICPDCRGTGYIEAVYPCFRCDGDGWTWVDDDDEIDDDDDLDEDQVG